MERLVYAESNSVSNLSTRRKADNKVGSAANPIIAQALAQRSLLVYGVRRAPPGRLPLSLADSVTSNSLIARTTSIHFLEKTACFSL
jgi:hypothetical protein